MTLTTVLVLAGVLFGIGLWGALSQQSLVMLMMGIEVMVNAAIVAAAGLWAFSGAGGPKGQVLVIVAMAVMAVEMAIGFALVSALYRARQADTTEAMASLRG